MPDARAVQLTCRVAAPWASQPGPSRGAVVRFGRQRGGASARSRLPSACES